jgi:endoglucanase
MKKMLFPILISIGVSILFASSYVDQTPVAAHGHLSVENGRIIDQHGNPVQLRGMSFFWSQWMGKFYNAKVVDWLIDDWKVTVVRAAMGVKHEETRSGYIYDRSEAQKAKTIIDAAIKWGIYVIIDWHDHYACKNIEESRTFFKEIAARYGTYPNVIYEIFNEPVWDSWKEKVKPYSETVVQAIREIDPDNLIILGSPHWCQDIDIAADDPLEGKNLVYALHFYAASHGDDLRRKAVYAMQKGIVLFASEFGACLATGDGFLDSAETESWFAFMDSHSISWCNWSIADKEETASALVPGARPSGRWSLRDLTPSGKLIRRKCRRYAGIIDTQPDRVLKKKSWLTVKAIE